MNAPLTSLHREPSISGGMRNGQFAAPKAQSVQGLSAARRSADLFEQLLSFPQTASSQAPIETTAPIQADSQPPLVSDSNGNDSASEQAVASSDHPDREDKGGNDETSVSTEAAAAALAASDALTNNTPIDDVSSTEIAGAETAAENSVSDVEQEIESATAHAVDEPPVVSELKSSKNSANPIHGDVASSSTPSSELTTDTATSELFPSEKAARDQNVVEPSAVPLAVEPDLQNVQIVNREASDEPTVENVDAQPLVTTQQTEPTDLSERSSKGDRKAGREKWYERNATKEANFSPEKIETETVQAVDSSAVDSSAENSIDVEQLSASVIPELAPFVVESTPSPVQSAVSDSWLVGAGLTSDALGSSSNTAASELGLPDESTPVSAGGNSSRRSSSVANQAPIAQPGEAIDLTQQEKIRLIQRVTRSFTRLGVDGGQINLRLHPPQLGSLNVQVRLEGRSMTAKLTTETSAARDAIIESLPVLKNRLAEQGFEISQFLVDVATNDNADATFGDKAQEHAYDRDAYRQSQQGFDNDSRRTARANVNQVGAARLSQMGSDLSSWQPSDGIDVHA